jgi:hypothetical protein
VFPATTLPQLNKALRHLILSFQRPCLGLSLPEPTAWIFAKAQLAQVLLQASQSIVSGVPVAGAGPMPGRALEISAFRPAPLFCGSGEAPAFGPPFSMKLQSAAWHAVISAHGSHFAF